MVCLECSQIFTNHKYNIDARKKHSPQICMGLKEDYERKGRQNCPIHNHIHMLNGRICQLCRPNCIVLGLTRHEIQQKKNRNLNYVFLYGVNNATPYYYNHQEEEEEEEEPQSVQYGGNITPGRFYFCKKKEKKQNVIIYCYIITLILKKL